MLRTLPKVLTMIVLGKPAHDGSDPGNCLDRHCGRDFFTGNLGFWRGTRQSIEDLPASTSVEGYQPRLPDRRGARHGYTASHNL